jgi:hypothetical protein
MELVYLNIKELPKLPHNPDPVLVMRGELKHGMVVIELLSNQY